MSANSRFDRSNRRGRARACAFVLVCLAPMLATAAQRATPPCTFAAQAARTACLRDAQNDYFLTLGKCANESDPDARARCNDVANARLTSANAECAGGFEARTDFCEEAGQAAYDPQIDPAQFVDPADIGGSVAPNPYFPIVRGSKWVYSGGGELNTVEVTSETRVIMGVHCAVSHDQVFVDGELAEDTLDFFAQDLAGNVWYFGENTAEYENGLISSIDGSFLAGRGLAKPGIAFEAVSRVGDAYRQEFSLGEAEDVARVVSTNASAQVPGASCNGTCIQTQEVNANDPGAIEDKYWAPGIGFILETDPDTGEHLSELISYHIGAQ